MKNRSGRVKIICYHLLNDYTGSTNILSSNLDFLSSRGFIVDVYSSFNNDGLLSEISGINRKQIYYKFVKSKFWRLVLFVSAQVRYFFSVFRYCFSKDVCVYVNTILPFGAAAAAYLLRKKIVYHVHEYPINRSVINRLGMITAVKVASRLIFVSEYVQKSFKLLEDERSRVLRNYISESLTAAARSNVPKFASYLDILMVCSLRVYKGVDIFMELARNLPKHSFTLVVSAESNEIERYFKGRDLPGNLLILPTQKDLHQFYSKANLVLNLTIPDQCIETFGLTVLEAISYGIPAIVPPVGGVTEIIEDGKNGFLVDPRDIEALIRTIEKVASDEQLYYLLSEKAKVLAERFSKKDSLEKLDKLFLELGR